MRRLRKFLPAVLSIILMLQGALFASVPVNAEGTMEILSTYYVDETNNQRVYLLNSNGIEDIKSLELAGEEITDYSFLSSLEAGENIRTIVMVDNSISIKKPKRTRFNSIVNTLVRLDILLDSSGKVRGQDGHNEYIYTSVIEIQGAGEYYVVMENHVSNDGTVKPTGLMYAVNTHDGTVNRLGYDSSGKYTLITISNR